MELNKNNVRQLMKLIVFTILIFLGVAHLDDIGSFLGVCIGIISPFLIGAGIAFILNAPMSFFEKCFEELKSQSKGSVVEKIAKPISLLLAILFVVGVVSLVLFVVMPELIPTITGMGSAIEKSLVNFQVYLMKVFEDNSQIEEWLRSIQIDWSTILQGITNFLTNGAGSVLSSTMSVAMSIISGTMTAFIAFVFACYLLLQKQTLKRQFKLVLKALLQEKTEAYVLHVCRLTYKTFSSFLTGQCIEAVILGVIFFVLMSVLKFPYALLVGVLVGFTALIPMFGAFFGCGVGAFLILMENPRQAFVFVIMFLVVQQLEGNLIYPKVVGTSIGLPSIWVLVAVTIGGSLMGVLGMLLFIPMASVMYSLLRDWLKGRIKAKENQNLAEKEE